MAARLLSKYQKRLFVAIRFSTTRPNSFVGSLSFSRSTGNMESSSSEPGSEYTCSRIAICHMRVTNNKEGNMQQVQCIVDIAKSKEAKMVFLPECCDFIGSNRKETLELAEPLTGPTIAAYRELAKNYQMWLACGGVHETVLDSDGSKTDKIHNTHVLISDTGDIVATYRKLHLFDVDTPEYRYRESNVVAKGETLISPIKTPIGVIGLQICYDLRFPEASTLLRKQGAEILTYPAAFAVSTGKAHWETLLKARAIENQCYVVASAQIGFHNAKRESYGHAMVIGPFGEKLAECQQVDLDVAIADLGFNHLYNIRATMPCFEHRRSDVYSLAAVRTAGSNDRAEGLFKFADFTIPVETVFYRSEHSFAFTNIRCVVPGHVLVATKRRVMRLKNMTTDEITDFFHTVCEVQKCTEVIYGTTSATITVQDGEDAGQTVKHVHCHIMPRQAGDFEHNDQIYIELNRHDHSPIDQRRQVAEMILEAERYRQFFAGRI